MNKIYKHCQSCNMSIKKDKNKGIEWDKTLSTTYCKNCYVAGKFTQPSITVREMQDQTYTMIKQKNTIMAKFFGKSCIAKIPYLLRWNPTISNN